MRKKHTNHSIVLQAMCLHGLRWEPFKGDRVRGELCFGGMRYGTELDHLGCPIIPNSLFGLLVSKMEGFPNQPTA